MPWPSVYLALLLSHLAGDFLLQTEWQAMNKRRARAATPSSAGRSPARPHLHRRVHPRADLARRRGRRARRGRCALAITLPHVFIDDGRFLRAWLSRVKHNDAPETWLVAAVDQTFHLVCLLPVAVVVATA